MSSPNSDAIYISAKIFRALLRSVGGTVVLDIADVLYAETDEAVINMYEEADPHRYVVKLVEKEDQDAGDTKDGRSTRLSENESHTLESPLGTTKGESLRSSRANWYVRGQQSSSSSPVSTGSTNTVSYPTNLSPP